jgi:ATP-dependent helicase/nuclease subunit A
MAMSERRILPDTDTLSRQANAANPQKSVWVSANAGSGKTYVLATRVIRLLLAGTDPARILCLTYTRTAAAEMKDRVFKRLGEWVAMPEAKLKEVLEELEGTAPDAGKVAFARSLFARALETPGGLKIQTIHAFCDALLHRFPLEANIPGHFEQPDTETVAALIGQARASMLAHVEDGTGGDLVGAFRTVIETAGESGLDGMLDEAVAARSALTELLRDLSPGSERAKAYRARFGFEAGEDAPSIASTAVARMNFDPAYVTVLAESAARHGKKTVASTADGLSASFRESDSIQRFEILRSVFLKVDGTPKTHNMFPAGVIDDLPDYEERFLRNAGHIANAADRMALLEQIENTLAALSVVDRLLSGYERLKRERGYLDFDDLIMRTANLLARPDVGAWVRYKLDQGIDHVLVDEAQDTSPLQWSVIRALTDEFFAGEAAREITRTLFAVGDEKQSIYSFQGADPASFGAAGEDVAEKAREMYGDTGFADVPLETSFRSTQDVLSAVDYVFETEETRRGVAYGTGVVRHKSLRQDQPGHVEIWPLERAREHDESSDWTAPVDTPPAPSIVVAERIANTICGWIKGNEVLEGTGKPIAAGDILVLVRSRDSFVGTLSRALKERGVPVAGADRLRMTDHIAVLDLLAIAKFVLQPADDLSLAAILRSPLFDLSEETLFQIAHGRGSDTLFEALENAAEADGHLAKVCAILAGWRRRSRVLPVYEFYASILTGERARERMIGRLGPETADMLDEFMRFALAQERAGVPSLQNFVAVLEAASPEIKREMDPAQAQVRIMTVHGAKGLEAPVVFLVDRGAAPHSANKERRFLSVDDGGGRKLVLWNAPGGPKSTVTEAARAVVAEKAEEEYRRLLYVGMTRAADRLIVAGYAGKHGGKDNTWHAIVSRALDPHTVSVSYPGFEAQRFRISDAPSLVSKKPKNIEEVTTISLPEWFTGTVPPEPPLPRPLAPSGASGMAVEPESESAPSVGAPSLLEVGAGDDMAPGLAVRRGTAVHRLLQMLPAVPPTIRAERAAAWCRQFESRWTQDDVANLVGQALSVLDDPALQPLFGSGSVAEAPVMGTLELGGESRAVSGVIDRIAANGDRVLIADYKTNAFVPRSVADIPDVYLRQMALYRALVEPLYPGRTVEAWLIYTGGPKIFALPAGTLENAIRSFNTA